MIDHFKAGLLEFRDAPIKEHFRHRCALDLAGYVHSKASQAAVAAALFKHFVLYIHPPITRGEHIFNNYFSH